MSRGEAVAGVESGGPGIFQKKEKDGLGCTCSAHGAGAMAPWPTTENSENVSPPGSSGEITFLYATG